ncbi:MAG: biotin--[acetyl-CoA-carboxylase] ligase [Chloroflexi bacterium]|nr:biotin--[acetyl-CoA-carboxylase] ligase [Chloroflexota bacterium]
MEFTAERIEKALAPRLAQYYPQAGSTNEIALNWLKAGAPGGAVVIADEQTSGRGRLGRSWHTPPGAALAVSVILRPRAAFVSQITMLGALAIHETLLCFGVESGIKWPNDVQVNGRKICGVLPEAVWDGERLLGVVLGMGLNVRVDFSGTELEMTAISLESALGRPVDRLELLVSLLNNLDRWYALLGQPALFDAWKSRLATLGQIVTIGAVRGLAERVDEDGTLWLRAADGALHHILAGDVVLGTGEHGN